MFFYQARPPYKGRCLNQAFTMLKRHNRFKANRCFYQKTYKMEALIVVDAEE
ncbi:hypothetical protein QYS48_28860 [Marivirga arenosa]|uniref:Uncharacterized protein n=1 Tax=Marivirga arenosa TaxID=3059076 RepID=A0AA51N7B2_9BACT|nr:hypothetical protein [Marivirga sp. ABR2-2]WMN07472.1 hypothetical protein QYS48_28860 [Marivirga sp. ABR2-2]